MNAGTIKTVRHWLLTLVVAAAMAGLTTGAILSAQNADAVGNPSLLLVDYESGGGGSGSGG